MTEFVTVKTPNGTFKFPKSMSRDQIAQAIRARTQKTSPHQMGDIYMGPEQGFISDEQARGMPANAPSRLDTVVRSGLQGSLLGYGDEVTAAIQSATTPGLSYGDAVSGERAKVAAGEERFPKTAVASEIAGAFMTPAPPVTSPAKAFATGAAGGMVYASGKADDGDRLGAAVSAAPESFLFSAGAIGAQSLIGKGMDAAKRLRLPANKQRLERLQKISGKLRGSVQRFETNPTVVNAKRVRDATYEAVDKSNFKFTKEQFDDALGEIYSYMQSPKSGYVKGDTKAEGALSLLEKNWGSDMKLSQVDDVRKRLMKRWVKADDAEAETIMEMVRQIDNLIDNSGGGDIMKAAREAHKTYMRLDFLEKAFEKAANRSSVTYAGGNQYNNYAKVFEKILSSEKQRRMFTPEMLEFMERAVSAPVSERVLRKLGKLSPDGNGLMLALSVIGGSVEPATIGAFGAGAAAKLKTDRAMMSRADDMMRLAAGLPIEQPAGSSVSTGLATGSAVAGQQEASP